MGLGLGGVGRGGGGAETGPGSSSVLAVGDLAKVAQAQGAEAGAVFVYTMPNPLALGPRQSALVPFLQQPPWTPSRWRGSPDSGRRRGPA